MFSQPHSPSFPTPARTRARLFFLSTALALVSGSAFAQDTGETAFEAYVDGLEALGFQIETGSVDYNEGNDTLTVSDIEMTFSGTIEDFPADDPGESAANDGSGDGSSDGATQAEPPKLTDLDYAFTFSSGTMTVTGLSHEDGDFEAASWTYSDDAQIVVTGSAEGKGRMKIDGRLKGILAANYSFTMPEIPEEDPAHQVSRWLPFARALVLTSYDEVKVDNFGLTFEAYAETDGKEALVVSGTSQIDGYRMADVEDGHVGEYTIDSMTQNINSIDPASGRMVAQRTSQGKTVYSDMDMGAMLDLFDPEVPESNEAIVALGSASAIDYSSTQDLGDGAMLEVTVNKVSMDEMTVLKRDFDFLALFDDVLAKKEPTPEELITGVFQLYRSLGVADARVSGIKVGVPAIGPQEPVEITIDEMAMTGISSDGIGEMMIVGLEAPDLPEGASLKLDWGAIGDIEFADYTPMRAMISTLMADPSFGEDNPLDVARAFMPLSFGYEIEGLDVTIPEKGRTQIGKAEMTVSTTVSPVPTSFHMKSEGLRMPVSAIEDPEIEALLAAIGLEEIVVSDETRLYWDEATLDLRLERMMVDIEGLGRAELTAHLANVPKGLFEDPENQGQMALVVAQFVDASLTFKDAGLAAKGLAHVAEAQGIPENVFREALVAQAVQMTAPIQNEAFTSMVNEAASKFLQNPGELKITLTPQKPVPLAQILGSMAAPQTLPDLLAVKVVAN
ncbi:hypothetical protein [Roseibium sp. M-1]